MREDRSEGVTECVEKGREIKNIRQDLHSEDEGSVTFDSCTVGL